MYEMYAGGAGASLNLLYSGLVSEIVINDYDKHIYYFWKSIIDQTEEFLRLVNDTTISLEEWHVQKNIYKNYTEHSLLEVGFSTFFLNRCNRSGILYKAGPIGGKNQTGNYKMDVRFNKVNLSNRIKKIANFGSKIFASSKKTIDLLPQILSKKEHNFIFLDPPYYNQGENLYLNFYNHGNHEALRNLLKKSNNSKWFLTYDNTEQINELYAEFRKADLPMSYTLQAKRKSKEVMVFADAIQIPKNLRTKKQLSPIKLR